MAVFWMKEDASCFSGGLLLTRMDGGGIGDISLSREALERRRNSMLMSLRFFAWSVSAFEGMSKNEVEFDPEDWFIGEVSA